MNKDEINNLVTAQGQVNNYIINNLFELFVQFLSLPPNKRTKIPSVTLTQEQAIDIVRAINGIVYVLGVQFNIKREEDGTTTATIEAVQQEGNEE